MVTDGDIVTMTGSQNTIIGAEPRTVMTGSYNTRVGQGAGSGNGGSQTTVIGASAGSGNTNGAGVTLVGYSAGQGGAGAHCTGVGQSSLIATLDGGTYNTALGSAAGATITTGDQNVCIGASSDAAATVNNQIAIGYGSVTDGANKMRLGNASLATADIKVDWTVDSDERIKENIQDADAGLEFINALRPVSFTRKHPADWPYEIREKIYTQGSSGVDEDGNEAIQSTPQFDVDAQQPIKDEFDDTSRVDGLLAQEVKAVIESLGVSFNGVNEAANGKMGIQYATLVVPLIKAVQELTARIEELENDGN